jgi:hypothetical protein
VATICMSFGFLFLLNMADKIQGGSNAGGSLEMEYYYWSR